MRNQGKPFRLSLQEMAITLAIVAVTATLIGFVTAHLEMLFTGQAGGSSVGRGAGAAGAILAFFWLQKQRKASRSGQAAGRS